MMRCDGEPVRLGVRTTRRMSRASQPDKQNGALSVHTIRASGHVHRNNRPNTRLHPTTTPNHQINPCNAGAIHTRHSFSSNCDKGIFANLPPRTAAGFRSCWVPAWDWGSASPRRDCPRYPSALPLRIWAAASNARHATDGRCAPVLHRRTPRLAK
jgi:hypothetical protein